jgi:hypothetical protein
MVGRIRQIGGGSHLENYLGNLAPRKEQCRRCDLATLLVFGLKLLSECVVRAGGAHIKNTHGRRRSQQPEEKLELLLPRFPVQVEE